MSKEKENFRYYDEGVVKEKYKPLAGKYLEILQSN